MNFAKTAYSLIEFGVILWTLVALFKFEGRRPRRLTVYYSLVTLVRTTKKKKRGGGD